MHPWKYC